MDLKGRIAIITGAGRGIGKAIAKDLARKGVNSIITSRTEEEITATAKGIEDETGVRCIPLVMDLSIHGNPERLIDIAMEVFGHIDILINNAAIIIPKEFDAVTLEEYDATLGINLKVPFILAQRALREMKKQHQGYIINIASTAALTVPPKLAAYGIAKKGMLGLSEVLYEEGKAFNVRVSTILPGVTNTEMVRGLFPNDSVEQWMQPEDVSYCVMFLLCQSSRVIVKELTPWAVGHDEI